MLKIDVVLVAIEENLWVCPQPARWNKLHEMIPNNCFSGDENAPEAPLILGSWWEASDTEKSERFIEHLRWADKQGVLEVVYGYMLNLKREDWLRR